MQQCNSSTGIELSKVKVGDYVVFARTELNRSEAHILRDTMDGVPYPIEAISEQGTPCACGCGADSVERTFAIIDDVADPVGLWLTPEETKGMVFKTRDEVEANA